MACRSTNLAELLMGTAVGLAVLAGPTDAVAQGDRVRTLTDTLPAAVGGVTVDRAGMIYIADFRETVWKVTPDGQASVFATGFYGASGNAIDSRGNLFQSNFYGNYISKVIDPNRRWLRSDTRGTHPSYTDPPPRVPAPSRTPCPATALRKRAHHSPWGVLQSH